MSGTWWLLPHREQVTRQAGPPITIDATGPLTLAATGDSVLTSPLGSDDDAAFGDVRRLIRSADIAVTNLEVNLLERSTAAEIRLQPGLRWPFGSEREAQTLKDIGFDVVTRANNHAADYGRQGIEETGGILDRVGLLHAGCGTELAKARAPLAIGAPGRHVALVSVATSSSAESRATFTRGEIRGRPGLSPLRYTADITVDPSTFDTLKETLAVTAPSAVSDAHDRLEISGTAIKKGAKTIIEFVSDPGDEKEILETVRAARVSAPIVVVAIHSHEPSNGSQVPAEFVRRFARAAIDAGASLVIGHGPHQLRGVEVYRTGAILYSLGNFLFQHENIDMRTADVYDAGTDLYQMALGTAAAGAAGPQVMDLENDVWWEGVVAVADFENRALKAIQFHPIDLGVGIPRQRRGVPRFATAERARTILQRLDRLSQSYGTRIRIAEGIGVLELRP